MPRILVIDDEEPVRKFLRELLEESTDHEVVEAVNGLEGLRLFEEGTADLVITDIFMPEQSGFEVIQALRKNSSEVKIISISGVGVREGLDITSIAANYGADRAFEKPFSKKEMLETVEELLKPTNEN